MYEGVELAVLASGIDLRRKVTQERFIVAAPGEVGTEPLRVHADHGGFEAQAQNFPGEGGGFLPPEGKNRLHLELSHLPLAVIPDRGQVEVSESHEPDPSLARA